MKPMLKIKYAICILICLTALHFNGYSQGTGTHLTMSLQNCAMPTPNTIQFDLMVVSDGDNALPVYSNSFQYGVNFNPAIIQPGCTPLTVSYIANSSDLLYTGQSFNFPVADSANHLRIVQTVFSGTQTHFQMTYQHVYRVGRFKIFSPCSWACNSSPNFTLQGVIASQQTVCAGLVYIGANTTTTSIATTGTGNLQRSLSVSCSLTLNPNNIVLSTFTDPVTCNGGADGDANVDVVSGGTGNYFYNWSNGGTDQQIFTLSAGHYTVTVTDDAGCSATAFADVTQPPTAVTPVCSGTNVVCRGASTGTVSVNTTGGTPGYTYHWNTGATTTSLSSLSAGTYCVTVTDAVLCTNACCFTVTQPAALTATGSTFTLQCAGNTNGTASVSASGGTAPYTYHWSNGANTSSLTGLAAGTYGVTVTDNCSATTTSSAAVNNPPALVATCGSTPAGCIQGSASVTASGGTSPYSYHWSNGPTTSNNPNLTAGNYTVTVTDFCGVTATCTSVVGGPTPITVSCSGTNATCFGSSNGSASVTVANGTPGYSYLWSNGRTTSNNISLTAGTYIVTATDACSATATCSYTVTQPTAITATCGGTNPTCSGGSTGTVSVTASGGTPGYTYLWSTGATTTSLTGRSAGTYTVTVTDTHNCTGVCTQVLAQPGAISVTAGNTGPYCVGDANSYSTTNILLTTTASGGGGTYTYAWTGPAGFSSTLQNPTRNGPLSINFNGVYTVTVTDLNGCTGRTTDTVVVCICNHLTFSVTNCSQPTANTMQFDAMVVSDGSPGTDLRPSAMQFGVHFNSQILQSGATVTINLPSNATSDMITIFGLNAFTFPGSSSPNSDVRVVEGPYAGGNTGLTMTRLTQYRIGRFTMTATANWRANTSPNFILQDLPGAGLSATVGVMWIANDPSTTNFDITGPGDCNTDPQVDHYRNVAPVSCSLLLNPCSGLTASATLIQNVTCFGGNNGSASATATGGVAGGYRYQWSNGATTQTVSNFSAGTYFVTVLDINACTGTASVTITQPATGVTATCGGTSITCNGGNNGSASVTASGGTGSLSYHWNTGAATTSISGLVAGTYCVTVTDASSCTAQCCFTVTQPTAVLAACSGTPVSCNGGNNGSASVTASGGTPGYTYAWSNGPNTTSNSNLVAGTYTVTVTDSRGCTATCSFIVTQPPALIATCGGTGVSCNGANNGTANVSASGGSPGYTYHWNGNATTTSISGLSPGTYSVTVTDTHSCTATCSFTVTQPAVLVATCGGSNISCNGGNNGSASVAASGGTSPYAYLWSGGGATTVSIYNLVAGTYSVTVTDSHGCTASCSRTITQPTTVLATCNGTNVSCNGGNNGTASVTASAGTGPYSYRWSNSTTGSVTIAAPSKDNTIFDSNTNNSNGAGIYFVAGETGQVAPANLVRGLLAFDVAGNVPAGATITGVTLTLHASLTSGSAGAQQFNLHKLSQDWGEGASNAGTQAGIGALGVAPDATWLNASLPSTAWTTAGGTFNSTVSGSAIVNTVPNFYSWSSTGMVGDVQSWLNSPVTNFGWLLKGLETSTFQAKRFDSKENTTPSFRPSLTINYTLGNSSSITNLSAGTYTVTVIDADGCTTSCAYTVTQPTAVSASLSGTGTTCNGGSNGTASVTASGGTPSYTYLWSTGAVTTSISGRSAGTYCVTVTDSHGCTGSSCFTITQPAALTISATSNSPVAAGSTLNLSSGAGFAPYSWVGPNGFTSTLQNPSISNVTVNAAGTYTVTGTNGGCSATGTTTVVVSVTPTILNLNVFLSGFMISASSMRPVMQNEGVPGATASQTDTIRVNLWATPNQNNDNDTNNASFRSKAILQTNGTASITYPPQVAGNSYWIQIIHRNHLETWSNGPIAFTSNTNYDFTNSMSSAYNNGFNNPMMSLFGKFAMWGGDVNDPPPYPQNGSIGADDMADIDNGSSSFLFGYYPSDCDGNGAVGISDMAIVDNVTFLFLFKDNP